MRRSDQENYAHNRHRATELERRRSHIQRLNDQLRRTLTGGRVMLTLGIRELGADAVQAIITAVREQDKFDEAGDPQQEHDFGALTVRGTRIFWKIDYYDLQLERGSPDPADPAVTARVLTIMLASEY